MDKRVLISGASGLIGTAVSSYFLQQGYQVSQLTRKRSEPALPGRVFWDVDQKQLVTEPLEGLTAVLHLAGANIADHRWTPEYKQTILKSRTTSTELLVSALSKLKNPPNVFISASAIGYYGNHAAGKIIEEKHPPGNDFLSEVCRQWEDAVQPLKKIGVRVVSLRFGVVLSSKGGALAKMLPVFKLGLGGILGSGEQVMSWIALDELPMIVSFILENASIDGALNCVAPQPVSNKGFTKILGDIIHRPTIFPVPEAVIKILLGEMGETLLLGGACVAPKKLLDAGYRFAYPDLRSALKKSI